MEDLELIRPRVQLLKQIIDYKEEHIAYNEEWIHGSSGLIKYDDINDYLTMELKLRTCIPTLDIVPADTYFLYRKKDDKIIGSIQFRHCLNKYLLQYAGHIGYGVRPTERRKGYGKKMLKMVLSLVKEFGLGQVLVTCDKDNIASKNTILSCGGVFENEVMEDDHLVERYWISLKKD